jgi:tRNA-dihydrouridine synthase A
MQLKRDFPHLEIIINGGVTSLEQAQAHLHQGVDGVMIGRSAYYDPFRILASADKTIYGDAGMY